MKDLFIIPECYIDTNLVETLIATEGCNHQKGCNTVVNTMKRRFGDKFAVGIIDHDKRQVGYVSEFIEIAHTDSLSLKKHKDNFHYLIMISPAMDGFILKCADELEIHVEEYGFSSCLKSFTSITKSITSKDDPNFKKLFKVLRKSSEMVILKKWLEYLKCNQYRCDVEILKRITFN